MLVMVKVESGSGGGGGGSDAQEQHIERQKWQLQLLISLSDAQTRFSRGENCRTVLLLLLVSVVEDSENVLLLLFAVIMCQRKVEVCAHRSMMRMIKVMGKAVTTRAPLVHSLNSTSGGGGELPSVRLRILNDNDDDDDDDGDDDDERVMMIQVHSTRLSTFSISQLFHFPFWSAVCLYLSISL